jgi:uncharacterized protein YkwD
VDFGAARVTVAVALAVLIGVVAAPAARPASAQPAGTLARLDSGILVQLNTIRAQHGLQPFRLNARLGAAATQHSHEMGASGYFEHESLDGTAFWKRIARWYGSSGYAYWSVGENLLWSAPDVDAPGAIDLWMHSPEHRANILSPRWREIGISAQHFASAAGAYKGAEVTIITTDFGVRR